ncbi:MAG TPA: LysM domain-containing protein [Candidatus Rifleibacterium sp.]|nr:LysM domain-containing protein [Candidatus Rifleibacterium sp.]HPT44544.1 LysM domain-containing protein [Candidatus Rifleibacterium sp.]
MRQTARSAGLLSLFLLNLTTLSAEPLVRGFFIEKLPEKVASKELAPDKSLVLAHVFNSSSQAMNSGTYQVGVEIENAGRKKTFVLKPQENISAGGLKTFRMAVPVSAVEKTSGQFRVFSKLKGNVVWSDKYSFLQGVLTDGDKKITTLYTEALPEPSSIKPPREVPFENEKSARKAAELERSVKSTSTKVAAVSKVARNATTNVTPVKLADAAKATTTVRPAEKVTVDTKQKKAEQPVKTEKIAKVEKAPAKEVETKVAAAPAPVAAEEAVQRPRNIDPAEFKKLRTIDEELIIYVVKEGDSLKSVAEKYYGSATKERAIADLNFIEKSSSVKVGEEIIVDVRPLNKSGKSNS